MYHLPTEGARLWLAEAKDLIDRRSEGDRCDDLLDKAEHAVRGKPLREERYELREA